MSILGYDAMLTHGEKSRRGGVGSAPVPGRVPVCAGRVPGGRGACLGRHAHDGVSMVSDLGAEGSGGPAGRRSPGSQAAAGSPAVGPDRPGAPARTHDPRVCDRPVDPAADRRSDRASHGTAVSPRACLADPAAPELVAPAAGAPSRQARRGGDSPVGARAVAGGKKNARRQRAWLVFEDESGVSQQPVVRRTWAPRGQTPS